MLVLFINNYSEICDVRQFCNRLDGKSGYVLMYIYPPIIHQYTKNLGLIHSQATIRSILWHHCQHWQNRTYSRKDIIKTELLLQQFGRSAEPDSITDSSIGRQRSTIP